MRARIIKISAIILTLMFVMAGGYFLGVHMERRENQKQAEESAQIDASDRGTKIAVVNLDEGTDTGGEIVQYAAQLLPYANVDYTVTGLQDARLGVQSGLYSSYVIIPSDFSRIVYSINAEPLAGRLPFTVSPALDQEKREEAFHNINTLGEYLNNSLTEIYLSSVMKEFHRAQDASDEIMANDKKDAELLEAVNAGSMIEMVEYPELVQAENTAAELDLTERYSNNENFAAGFGASYQGFLNRAQEDISQTKGRSEAVYSLMGTAGGTLADANQALEEITFDDELGMILEKGEEARAEAENTLKKYDAYIEQYNSEVTASNGQREPLLQALSEYERIETAYQQMLSGYISKTEEDQYAFADIDAYMMKLAESLQAEAADAVPAPYTLWEDYFAEKTEQMAEGEYCRMAPVIKDYVPDQDTPGEDTSWTEVKPAQKLSEMTGDDGTDLETSVLKQIDDIAAFVREEVTGIFGKKTEEIGENYRQAAIQYTEAGTRAGELDAELGGYDMASYVDEQEVSSIERDMDTNLREIETEVSEYTGAYDQYVNDVYQAAGDNTAAVREKVAEAQESSEKLLEESLEEAKISRRINNEVNSLLLGELSEKLPYTRIGGVENKEVYGFMASPFLLREEEPDTKQSGIAVESTESEQEESKRKVLAVLAALACAMIIMRLAARFVSAGRRRRAMHEF